MSSSLQHRSSSPSPLTILVIPLDCVGHVNACIGTSTILRRRGHRIVFMLESLYAGSIGSKYNFEEEIYKIDTDADDDDATNSVANGDGGSSVSPGQLWAKSLLDSGVIGPSGVEEKYHLIVDVFHWSKSAMKQVQRMNVIVSRTIERIQPDVIMFDAAYLLPAIYYSGRPWIVHMSITVLLFASVDSDEFPPSGSGYASNAVRDEKFARFKKMNKEFRFSSKFNDLIEHQLGYRRYPNDCMIPHNDANALLSLYACPEEFNYPAIRRLHSDWFNLEVFHSPVSPSPLSASSRSDELCKYLPPKFVRDTLFGKWSGKWIYLSLGTMGSIDVELMRKLCNALSGSGPLLHKYIISKGPYHNRYDLPQTGQFWGAKYLPQTKLLPLVDLVVTHGGNNTVTECFAYGKPMVVLPLFGDQYDNAQRLHETGFGIRLDPYSDVGYDANGDDDENPYRFSANRLQQSIEQLLSDKKLHDRLNHASERIRSTDMERRARLAQLIEDRYEKWLAAAKQHTHTNHHNGNCNNSNNEQ